MYHGVGPIIVLLVDDDEGPAPLLVFIARKIFLVLVSKILPKRWGFEGFY